MEVKLAVGGFSEQEQATGEMRRGIRMGWDMDGMGWDGMGWDGMGWDGMGIVRLEAREGGK